MKKRTDAMIARDLIGTNMADWRNGAVAIAQAAEAQVFATLALVEQQRIANLIAFHDLATRQDQRVLSAADHERIDRVGLEIREALGLT